MPTPTTVAPLTAQVAISNLTTTALNPPTLTITLMTVLAVTIL